ncbi:stage II sporulation protein M [Solibacillus sp. FSL K6-1523]|uniref:stage II sporulation protein M n=1 Tax=Solibacillus sp. FSL K6-1523 TaxID=2921471 RepID=UPI0030FAF369
MGFEIMMYTKTEIFNQVVFKRAIKFIVFSAAITMIATIITYIINPDIKEVVLGMEESLSIQIKESTGIDRVWSYVINNGFAVPLQMLILALIPIQFIYLLNIISTTSLLGVFWGIALLIDEKGFELIIASIPHAVFEIFAYCIFAAVLFELNQVIRVKVRNNFKKDNDGNSFINKFVRTIIVYAVFVLPIILVAAFLETYIADIILDLFE